MRFLVRLGPQPAWQTGQKHIRSISRVSHGYSGAAFRRPISTSIPYSGSSAGGRIPMSGKSSGSATPVSRSGYAASALSSTVNRARAARGWNLVSELSVVVLSAACWRACQYEDIKTGLSLVLPAAISASMRLSDYRVRTSGIELGYMSWLISRCRSSYLLSAIA